MTSNRPGMINQKSKVQSPKSKVASRDQTAQGKDGHLVFPLRPLRNPPRPLRLIKRLNRKAPIKNARQVLNLRGYAAIQQTLQKRLSIHLRPQTRIENRQDAAIRGAANQATETLLQRDDRLRHAVFVKTRAALLFDVTLSRRDDWI